MRELSDGIRGALERNYTNIRVAGEISGVKLLPSGHCYFALKDSEAQIKCVCWKLSYWRLKFKPKDGVQAIIRGRVDIYEQRSEYQFVVEAIEPRGEGALQLAFEELKKKLAVEGLFDAAFKRALPRYPRRIGIVTSPQGAVIQDFLKILSRRFPGLHIRLFPARVQGTEASGDVIRGLDYFGVPAGQNWLFSRGAAALRKTSGPSTKSPSHAPSPLRRFPWFRRSATRPMSRSRISSRISGHPHRRPPAYEVRRRRTNVPTTRRAC